MKKRSLYLSTAALTGLCLTGCGSSSHAAPDATSASSSASSTSSSSTSSAGATSHSASPTHSASSAATRSGARSTAASPEARKGSGAKGAAGAKGAPSGSSVGVPKTSAVSISIPSIGLNHGIVPGGLSGGVLSPAAGTIVQFTGYNRVIPGQPGIAVLAGHVTYNGPDVFYSLHNTPAGAPITITYADGTTKKFVATGGASINKDALQADPRVWGSSSSPVVALITCDASSGWVNAHHHANNYVIWARPA